MKTVFLALFIICPFLSNGQSAPSIQWVPTGGETVADGKYKSQPNTFCVWNNKLYFEAFDSTHGTELWSYDEVSPAKMVCDLDTGLLNGLGNGVQAITAFKNKLYMRACKGSSGTELFSYNGTPPQVQVSNVWPGGFSGPFIMVASPTKLYFAAQRSTNGSSTTDFDLYSYDGVSAPSRYNIPGRTSNAIKGCAPNDLTMYNGKLYFSGDEPSGTRSLYVLDPATNTPSIVGTAGSYSLSPLPQLTVINNKLYFIGFDVTHNSEVWSYDGTTMKRLTDVATGNKQGAVSGFAYYNGEVYFSGSTDGANFQLYKIDVDGNARLVYTVNPTGNAGVRNMVVYKNSIYFIARTSTTGNEWWRYNGTTCTIVADLYPGTGSGALDAIGNSNSINNYAIYNGHLYFLGNDGVRQYELFRINDPTGIQNIKWDGSVIALPNPTTGNATLSMTLQRPEALNISLTDMAGRVVYNSTTMSYIQGKNEVPIPMENLAAAQYYYTVRANDGAMLVSGSLVKQ